jgi:SpoVK/Ycf46/Vps4 family AAA+-type ATPase
MKQETLRRLFRSIEGDRNDDIVKVAYAIIEDEEKNGHRNLANQLRTILDSNLQDTAGLKRELRDIFGTKGIPVSKRFQIPLAIHIERENLRHQMVLPPNVEDRFARIEQEYVARDRLAHHGLQPSRKILLYGPPGCGKSMGAERIAWNIGLPFLKVRFEAIISSYLGDSLNNLRTIFERVNSMPCVLLLDEFDIIAKSRGYGQDVGEMYRIVNMLLFLLDEYDAPGLLIATTNLDDAIDKAIFRRFDEVIEMPKPGIQEMVALLKMTMSSMNVAKSIDWNALAKKMTGFSAAQVVKVAKDAAKLVVIRGQKQIGKEHFEIALAEIESR